MKAVLPLFVFIDACGWEIIKNTEFMRDLAPTRKSLTSVFGYSSACVPSIVSGRWPAEHRNWSYFIYSPEKSPFRFLRPLRWLPRQLTSRRIFRRWLSKLVKRRMNFRGYFDLYNVPFEHISLYDFTEKKSPLQPGGMNQGPNIFDHLEHAGIPYHVSAPQKTEEANLAALLQDIRSESIDFAFLYWPGLDGLLHQVGNQSSEIAPKLQAYENWIRGLYSVAEKHYGEVRLYVFSDHGMANCNELLDLKARVEALPLRIPQDYAVVYDSTMARFWFNNGRARKVVTELLDTVPQGRVIPDQELQSMGAFFDDGEFGQLIYLVKEGVLIVPSHMGERPIRAMHGYHPNDPQSYAALCTNQPAVPDEIAAIPDIFRLMSRDAALAHAQNHPLPEAILSHA
jgi:predicted AlkP superfamily pyrophosphatase or phosphodiesterase